MMQVLDFIKWGLTHVKKSSVPAGAILPIPISEVGSAGEWEYLYGTTGNKVTQSLLDSKYNSYYNKNGWSRALYDKTTAGWVKEGRIVCDCQGVEDNYSKSQTNANGNYAKYCDNKGLCSSINRPYILGEVVFHGSSDKKTHIGWVCGFMPNGEPLVMEERGLSYGFVVTLLSKRAWKYRGLMTKRYDYDADQKQPETGGGQFIFTRMLRFGCIGDDVKELKKALAAKGYASLTVTNGNYLGSTLKVVETFQADKRLVPDGIVGPKTYTALGVTFKL